MESFSISGSNLTYQRLTSFFTPATRTPDRVDRFVGCGLQPPSVGGQQRATHQNVIRNPDCSIFSTSMLTIWQVSSNINPLNGQNHIPTPTPHQEPLDIGGTINSNPTEDLAAGGRPRKWFQSPWRITQEICEAS
jgi:hypothetical protein